MSFALRDLPYDESRLGTAYSIPDQASISGLSSKSGLSSLTLVDSTVRLQNTTNFIELDIDVPKIRSKVRLYAILFALYLSLFLAALDQSIVATAVPTIASDLKSSQGYVWIGSAYILAMAAGGPIWSNLSDIFGRKIILLIAVSAFFGSSIACAAAGNIAVLIFGRVVQGLAGGGLFLLVNVLISDLFSVRERSLYLGLLEVVWAIAGGVGPVLGGTFTELVSWRWCFWINLPVSGLTFIILLVFLDVHNPKTPFIKGIKAIDWLGSFFILAFTIMFLVGIELGGVTFPWKSPQVICLIVFGVLMLPLFVLSERKAKYPLIPLDLLENWSNVASSLVCLFHGMVYMAQEYYLPLYFQSVLAVSPIRSGILILPILLSQALMGMVCGVIIHRTGRYLEITYFGCILMTIGVALYTTFAATSSIPYIIGIEIIAGLGAGCLFEPPLIALYAFVSQERTASATSTLGFIRCIGQALSLVLGGVVFQNSMILQISKLVSGGVPSSVTDLLSGGHAVANVMIVSTISEPTKQMAVKEAFVWSLRNMWILYACLSGLACLASVFIGKRKLDTKHVETKTGLT